MKLAARAVFLFLLALAAGSAGAGSGQLPLLRHSLGEIGGWMIVSIEAGGLNGAWLLDTGSSHNLVSADFAERHGLEARSSKIAVTAQGRLRAPEVSLPALRFGSLTRDDQKALVVELNSVVGAVGDDLDGILGISFFSEFELNLDLKQWQVEIRDNRHSSCPAGTAPVSLDRFQGLPVIEVIVDDGKAESVLLDTGNPAGLIRILSDPPDTAEAGIALPGPSKLNLARSVRLGNQLRLNVPLVQLQAPELKRALGKSISGLAGTALLDGARFVIDLSRNRACVENGSFAVPGGFGLTLEKDDGSLRIASVLAGGPAQAAGLMGGEVIRQWAGLPASSPLPALWAGVQGLDEIEIVLEPEARRVRLRRAYYAPLLQ